MTKAKMELEEGRYCLMVEGHATGSEAVCAGVSALVFALAGYLLHVEGATVERCTLESGNAEIVCTGDGLAEAGFVMAGVGLAQLAAEFPEYIAIDFFEK